LGHGRRGRHWRRLTRNGRLQSEGSRSWGSQPEIALSTG
jgi:hypothetical protein